MSKCSNCNVSVRDTVKICPLCRHSLEIDTTEENKYPQILEKIQRQALFLRIYLASTIGSCLLLIFSDYYFTYHIDWSIIIIATLCYGYYATRQIIYRRCNLFTTLSRLIFFLAPLLFIIDTKTGFYRWSLDYTPAALLIAENIMIIFFVFFDKKNRKSYVYYDIGVLAMNIPLFLLYKIHIIHFELLLSICIQTSILVFLSFLIVGGISARKEIARRLHVKKK